MDVEAIFTQFPVITTPRFILRQIQMSDAEALFATFGDEAVMEFYGEMLHHSIADSRDLIRRQQEWYARHEGIRWGITRHDDDTVIGSCGFFKFDEGFHCAESGYDLARAHWHQGVMTEAFGAAIAFAFATIGLHRIEAVVDDVNERSKGLLRKLGFTHEGTLRQRFFFRERFIDEHYFGLLHSEWTTPMVQSG